MHEWKISWLKINIDIDWLNDMVSYYHCMPVFCFVPLLDILIPVTFHFITCYKVLYTVKCYVLSICNEHSLYS
jgi:hypothetical protein